MTAHPVPVECKTQIAPIDIYGGRDPRTLPTYAIRDAARYLGIAPAILRGWIKRTLISLPEPDQPRLSFENLLEAQVLKVIQASCGHKIAVANICRALDYAQRRLDIRRLLLHKELEAAGGDLLLERLGALIPLDPQEQVALGEALHQFLERVERDEHGMVQRFYPILPGHEASGPKTILIDPRVSFGRPILAQRGLSTSILAERYECGEGVEELAYDYDIKASEVEEALRFEKLVA